MRTVASSGSPRRVWIRSVNCVVRRNRSSRTKGISARVLVLVLVFVQLGELGLAVSGIVGRFAVSSDRAMLRPASSCVVDVDTDCGSCSVWISFSHDGRMSGDHNRAWSLIIGSSWQILSWFSISAMSDHGPLSKATSRAPSSDSVLSEGNSGKASCVFGVFCACDERVLIDPRGARGAKRQAVSSRRHRSHRA